MDRALRMSPASDQSGEWGLRGGFFEGRHNAHLRFKDALAAVHLLRHHDVQSVKK
jgi:hypothetical protein